MRCLLHIAVAGIISAVAVSAENSTIKCAPGLKMFVSRGTGESTPLGATKALVDTIANQISGSSIQPILYPATWEDPVYMSSVANGTRLVRKAITEYAKACPDSKMALFGYSQVYISLEPIFNETDTDIQQGAQITSNNLCGMSVVWGIDQIQNLALTPAKLKEILELSQPLSKELTKNGQSILRALAQDQHRLIIPSRICCSFR